MKRIAIVAALLLGAAALAGVLRPDGASAVGKQDTVSDTVTVSGFGSVDAVPDKAQISAGVETRGSTAKEALNANAAAMRKVIAALEKAGAKNVQTQFVSLNPFTSPEGKPDGFVASNTVSAEIDLDGAGELIDAAVAAGATNVYGPSLSISDSDALYRQALKKAVTDAKARAELLAGAAGRGLGRVIAISEGGGAAPVPLYAKAGGDAADSTPVVPGTQETSATVSVTYELT